MRHLRLPQTLGDSTVTVTAQFNGMTDTATIGTDFFTGNQYPHLSPPSATRANMEG